MARKQQKKVIIIPLDAVVNYTDIEIGSSKAERMYETYQKQIEALEKKTGRSRFWPMMDMPEFITSYNIRARQYTYEMQIGLRKARTNITRELSSIGQNMYTEKQVAAFRKSARLQTEMIKKELADQKRAIKADLEDWKQQHPNASKLEIAAFKEEYKLSHPEQEEREKLLQERKKALSRYTIKNLRAAYSSSELDDLFASQLEMRKRLRDQGVNEKEINVIIGKTFYGSP